MITRFNSSKFSNTRKHTWLRFSSDIKITAVRKQQQHVGRHTQDDYKIISKHHSYACDKHSSSSLLSLSLSTLMLSNNIHPIRSMQSPYYKPSNFVGNDAIIVLSYLHVQHLAYTDSLIVVGGDSNQNSLPIHQFCY